MTARLRSPIPVRLPAMLIAATFLLAAPAITAADLEATPAQAEGALPLVLSATPAIGVVAVELNETGPLLRVSLQNTSPKTIMAYSVGSDEAWVTQGYYFSETAFPPNEVITTLLPVDRLSGETPSHNLTVTAVLFEDGTTSGRAIPAFRLREHWTGLTDYARRIVPCLQQLPKTLSARDEAAMIRCDAQAGRSSSQGRSSDYDDGLHNGRRKFSTALDDITAKIRSGDFSGAETQRDRIVSTLTSVRRR